MKKLTRIYKRNPVAYLSLASITVSLIVGTYISSLGQTPQISGVFDPTDCEMMNKSECRQYGHECVWFPGRRLDCYFNAQNQCPQGCQYTPAQTTKCSDIKQKQACSPPCRWSDSSCEEYERLPCSSADCNAGKNGCYFKNTYSCSCQRWKNDIKGCLKNDCKWEKQTTCAGQYKTNKCLEKNPGSCTGSVQQITRSKCEGQFEEPATCMPQTYQGAFIQSDFDENSQCNPKGGPVCPEGLQCFAKIEQPGYFICVEINETVPGSPPDGQTPVNQDSECSPDLDPFNNPCKANEVCVAVTNTGQGYASETYKCLTQPLGLRACELNGVFYDHGVAGSGYCVKSNGRTTGYWRQQVCSDGQWVDGRQTWNPQTCPQEIKCADFNLNNSDSWEGFQRLGCCPKINKDSKETNEFGQNYSSLAGTTLYRQHCQPKTSNSFLDALKEIF